jgi:hypothetical protein
MDFLIGLATAVFALPWAMRAARVLAEATEAPVKTPRRVVRR